MTARIGGIIAPLLPDAFPEDEPYKGNELKHIP